MITKDYSLFARVYLPITCKFLTQVIIIITITMVIIDHHRSSIIDHHHHYLALSTRSSIYRLKRALCNLGLQVAHTHTPWRTLGIEKTFWGPSFTLGKFALISFRGPRALSQDALAKTLNKSCSNSKLAPTASCNQRTRGSASVPSQAH
jgi:hypothetical protein